MGNSVNSPLFAPIMRMPPLDMKSTAAHARPNFDAIFGVARFSAAREMFSAKRSAMSHEGLSPKSFRKKRGTYLKLTEAAICVRAHMISVHMGISHLFRTPQAFP